MDVDTDMNEILAEKKYPQLPEIKDDEEDQWMYNMRRTMQEIVPGLFLGPYTSATKNSLESMKAAGLTHVVCVRSNQEALLIRANHMEHFQYMIVQLEDSMLQTLIPSVKTVSTFIDTCLKAGGKVLVHGNAGTSRSAALVVGYIMGKYGVSFGKASRYVQTKRFCVSVGRFVHQLKAYEPIYKAMHSTPAKPENAQHDAIKRSIDEVLASDDEEPSVLRPRLDKDCEGNNNGNAMES